MTVNLPCEPPSAEPANPPSDIVLFLAADGQDCSGRSFEDVLALDDAALERRHDFIQWLFPLPEPSRAVPGSPVLTEADVAALRASAVAQERLVAAGARLRAFYRANGRWRQSYDHNHLRITRIVTSLRLLAGDAAADAFKAAILAEAEGAAINDETVGFWQRA